MDIQPLPSRLKDLGIVIGLFLAITLVVAAVQGRGQDIVAQIQTDVQKPMTIVLLIAALVLVFWGLGPKRSPRVRKATFAALIALTIAWYAHVDLLFASFLLTFGLVWYFYSK